MEGKAPLRPRFPGLTKSESNSSVGAGSVKSCNSVSALGAHPLGTLHVHEASDAEPVDHDDDDDEGPPPLEPAAGEQIDSASENHRQSQYSVGKRRPTSLGERLTHEMGGGDVVLILDLPELFTVGYDSVSFTGKHFGGVRDIPPGAHFFWVAHPGGLSTRCGAWVFSTGVDTVHVLQWDKFNEVLGESARAEARIQAENLDSIHSKLVPYSDPSAVNAATGDLTQAASEQNLKMWGQLTSSITESVLTSIIGRTDDAYSWMVHTADRVRGSILMAAEVELDNATSNPLLQTRELNFTFNQLSKTYSTNHTGADRTLEATDSTPYITSLIEEEGNGVSGQDLVGEFQFAYIVGMHLGNDSCIQQWWHMVLRLILRAHILPARSPVLAAAFIRTLTAQMSYGTSWLEGSILDYSESQARDLRLALIVYKRRLDELLLGLGSKATADQLTVGAAFAGLEAAVATGPGWDLRGDYVRRGNVMMEDGEEVELEVTDLQAEDERGEWAPEVVTLDETGRQRDLVSWTD